MIKPILNTNINDHIKQYIIDNNLCETANCTVHSLDNFLLAFRYVLSSGLSWKFLNDPVFKGAYDWKSIYRQFNAFVKLKVFENVYEIILKTYFKTNKLNCLSIDSSLIKNERTVGAKCGYKGKRTLKLYTFFDTTGIRISDLADISNTSDQSLSYGIMVDIIFNNNDNSNNNNNKTKQYAKKE